MICRDCGTILAPDARGCPTCALNLEAENMIGRVLWRVLVPIFALTLLLVLAILYLIR
jgi:hypothetical protein